MIESKQLEDEIKKMVDDILLKEPSLFVVGLRLRGSTGNQRLTIWLDGDQGVTIEQCSMVSRLLASQVEEKDLIEGKYHLEVSSAGVDFPLQLRRQYLKNIGRRLKVTLQDGTSLEGELKEVKDDVIVLDKYEINLERIEKSIVLVSFK